MKENKRDRMELQGIVIDEANGKFRVKINDNHIVLATLSGKVRKNLIRIILGDLVICEVSEYDTSMGRIVRRVKN
jgi:translation initiation factor IF-1